MFTGQYYAATSLPVSILILLLIYSTFVVVVVVYRTILRGNHAPCVHFNHVDGDHTQPAPSRPRMPACTALDETPFHSKTWPNTASTTNAQQEDQGQ